MIHSADADEVLASMRRLLADGCVMGFEERDASGTVVNVVVTGLTAKGRELLEENTHRRQRHDDLIGFADHE